MGEKAPEKTLRELYEPDVHQRPIGEVSKVVTCGVYGLLGHHNDRCPKLKEVNVMGGYRSNDSQSNTYNSYWRDHPNLRWGPQELNLPTLLLPHHHHKVRT
ncbi:retrotransposon gag protein [Cucumis melo var. makuwa]|uniref:Retrotransposon gag protein n=1 Tax=Cucumis melo var. makuwa TaxID=1194695 RepID=A0A5A7V7V6_CUCMM|nr:retrotransposon gag protein [Cucumis melo var. makuwa]